jgi:hypothetical protein
LGAARLRLNDDEIVLDELNTTYSADVGSDYFTREYDRLLPGGSLDAGEVEQWLAQLAVVQKFDDAQLETEPDHL